MTTVSLDAYDLPLLSATKATIPGRSEPMIAIGFGHDIPTADFFAISITDAQYLRQALDAALASSVTNPNDEEVGRAHL